MLQRAAAQLIAGERNYQAIEATAREALTQAGWRPDYFTIRRAEDLGEPNKEDTELRILAAAWLGRARLIDNCPVTLPQIR
jgi:pantoate--beta-alanine ligase